MVSAVLAGCVGADAADPAESVQDDPISEDLPQGDAAPAVHVSNGWLNQSLTGLVVPTSSVSLEGDNCIRYDDIERVHRIAVNLSWDASAPGKQELELVVSSLGGDREAMSGTSPLHAEFTDLSSDGDLLIYAQTPAPVAVDVRLDIRLDWQMDYVGVAAATWSTTSCSSG